jgi:hypothetical protein
LGATSLRMAQMAARRCLWCRPMGLSPTT